MRDDFMVRGMSVGRRLLSNTIANAAGISMSAVLQIVSVPVLTASWGVEGYGVWLMLTTIPAYLALTDFGFVQAATSDMTMQVARGERGRALRIFQSLWGLVWAVTLTVVCVSSLLLALRYSGIGGGWLDAYAAPVFVLVAYSGLALCFRVILAGFRSTGNYALGALLSDTLALIEGLSILAVAAFGGGHLAAITTILCLRAVGMAVIYGVLRWAVPWLRLGVRQATVGEARRLFAPAFSAMMIPASLSLNLQGVLLVVGAVLSPAAASIFATVRTASRLLIQIVGTLNRAAMPELSAASATGRRRAVARILGLNIASVVLVLVPGAVVFAFCGKAIVEVWSHGRISPDAPFVFLMALVMVVHGAWYYTANMLLATNSHGALAGTLLAASVATVALAVPAAGSFGLEGVAVVLVLNETVCLARVLRVVADRKLASIAELKAAGAALLPQIEAGR